MTAGNRQAPYAWAILSGAAAGLAGMLVSRVAAGPARKSDLPLIDKLNRWLSAIGGEEVG
jgi:hypothetical protein